jgi:hypothetical protein
MLKNIQLEEPNFFVYVSTFFSLEFKNLPLMIFKRVSPRPGDAYRNTQPAEIDSNTIAAIYYISTSISTQ